MNFVFQVLSRFFIAGLFTLGGGMAVIPFFNEMAIKYGWLTTESLAVIIAVSQSMPGLIGVNMATFTGNVIFGTVWGGFAAALAIVFPCATVAILVARVLQKFKENRFVRMAFYGIRPAVVALITAACLGLFSRVLLHIDVFEQTGNFLRLFNIQNIAIYGLLLAAYFMIKIKGKRLSPVIFIIASACTGIILKL